MNKPETGLSAGRFTGSCAALFAQLNLKPGILIDFGGYLSPMQADLPNPISGYKIVAVDGELPVPSTAIETVKKQMNGSQDQPVAAIAAVDFLNHCADADAWLALFAELADRFHCPFLCGVPNLSNQKLIFDLLDVRGARIQSSPLLGQARFFTESVLLGLMKQHGFEPVGKSDLSLSEQELTACEADDIFSAPGSITHSYLEWLKQFTDPNAETAFFFRAFEKVEDTQPTAVQTGAESPFLSIVTRTQGKRIDALEETFLCLTAQTNTDFELLLLGHNVEPCDRAAVLDLVSQTPAWLEKKIQYIDVTGGTRTTPLNVGFSKARGDYVVILDDDDLVTDDWVDSFYQLSLKSPGSILHAYGVAQEWQTIQNKNGETALRAIGSPDRIYCRDFNLLEQLNLNTCPTMTYACPRYAYQTLGIRFNEDLTTTEDWDFLMRTAFVCGVADIPVVTSIYRLWKNNENSQTLHNRKEWLTNEKMIKKQLNQMPIVFPAGFFNQESKSKNKSEFQSRQYRTSDSVLYLDHGEGFNQDCILIGQDRPEMEWTVGFPIAESLPEVTAVRFDPMDQGMFWMTKFEIHFTFTDGTKEIRTFQKSAHNGVFLKNSVLFYKDDPQILIHFKSPKKLKSVKAKFEIDFHIPDEVWKRAFLQSNWKLSRLYRFALKLKQKLFR